MRPTQSVDTSEAIEQRLMAAYGATAPWEKLHIVSELSKASFELAAAGIGLRHPGASDEGVRLILSARRLGTKTVLRATRRTALPFAE